jgi:hypothetical protein
MGVALLANSMVASLVNSSGSFSKEMVCVGSGLCARVVAWRERGLEAHDVHLTYWPADAKWDGLCGDAGFSDLVARCHFET